MGHSYGEMFGYANDELHDTLTKKKLRIPTKVGKTKKLTLFDFESQRQYYRASPEKTLGYRNSLTGVISTPHGRVVISFQINKEFLIEGRTIRWGFHKSGSTFADNYPVFPLIPSKMNYLKTPFDDNQKSVTVLFSKEILGKLKEILS